MDGTSGSPKYPKTGLHVHHSVCDGSAYGSRGLDRQMLRKGWGSGKVRWITLKQNVVPMMRCIRNFQAFKGVRRLSRHPNPQMEGRNSMQ
jgi:hypothetical protein